MAKDSYCEHLADGEHAVLPVVAYDGHCLLPVLGDGNTRLAKDSKKQLVQKSGKVWFDNAMHDPLDLASSSSSGHTAPPGTTGTLQYTS